MVSVDYKVTAFPVSWNYKENSLKNDTKKEKSSD